MKIHSITNHWPFAVFPTSIQHSMQSSLVNKTCCKWYLPSHHKTSICKAAVKMRHLFVYRHKHVQHIKIHT